MPSDNSDSAISRGFRRALAQPGLVDSGDTSLVFYDMERLQERLADVTAAFPPATLHAVAIKANPIPAILKRLVEWGSGLEAASLPELHLALNAGCRPERIVFDSPAKTMDELRFALSAGVNINADSLEEIGRIASVKAESPEKYALKHGVIGLRINPQAGTGSIAATSVAGEYSKFGVAIRECREEIIRCYLEYDWLTGIHLHIGSQGCDLALLLDGVETVYRLALDIDDRLRMAGTGRRIMPFDLGGGLPVSYHRQSDPIPVDQYAGNLKLRCPELFTERFRLVTEFGRYVHAGSAWAVSRVEYVKECAGIRTAIIHLGADMFLRKCYCPDDWHHEISVLDKDGAVKTSSEPPPYTIAGPLCFSGDIIARAVMLPVIEPGDWVVIHDAGAYTLGMWSRYNSRQMPKVIGYREGGCAFEIFKSRETIAQAAGMA